MCVTLEAIYTIFVPTFCPLLSILWATLIALVRVKLTIINCYRRLICVNVIALVIDFLHKSLRFSGGTFASLTAA